MKSEIKQALENLDTLDLESGYEMGVIHKDCPEFQTIMSKIHDLTKDLIQHHSTCEKR